MPSWIPRQRSIQDQLADEIAKQEAIRFVQQAQRNEPAAWTPLPEMGMNVPGKGIMAAPQLKPAQRFNPAISVRPTPELTPMQLPELTPIQQEIASYMPEGFRAQAQPTVARVPSVQGVSAPSTMTAPATPTAIPTPINKTEVKPAVPFWQRALQVFAAPFNWIDEYLIKPGLSVAATAVGAVPEVERKPGEDYWVWKRRSWAEWQAPGVDINVPWSDKPWRVDIKGVAELAPWLLIPGAGQIAGALGKLGKVGKVAGAIVSYSPWGLAEKTAGVAIKGGVKAVGKVSGKVSTVVGEKLFGKYVPPPTPPEVTKLAAHFKETVMPSYRAFQKAKPELRARQEAKLQAMEARYRRGEISLEEIQAERNMARFGGIKAEYALTPEALAARQAGAIAEVEAKVVAGEYSESVGKALVTKLRKSPAFSAMPVTPEITIKLQEGYKWTPKTHKWFEDFKIYSQKVSEATSRRESKYPPVTDKDLALWKKDWKAFSRKMGYTEKEIIDYEKYLQLVKEGKELGASEDSLMGVLYDIEQARTALVRGFTQAEVKTLHDMMNDAFQNGLVEAESKDAFMDLMLGKLKTLPEKHNLIQWKAVFGDDFAKAVGNLGSPGTANQVVNALSIPKSLVSMMDMSGFGRQGLFFLLLHPSKIPKWFVKYSKSFLSEKLTLDMDDALRARPIAKVFQQGKTPGYLRPVREAPLALREEAYPAMLERIPFLRRSGRSFNAGLNEMTLDTFEAGYNAMIGQGATEAQIDVWRGFINMASGRGTLPKALDKYAPALNLAFFSPRLQAATLQLPRQIGRMIASGNPYMRQAAARTLITFVGGGATLLGLLNATGRAKVEGDPRSGDFGKIRIGETRLDIWRGYIQYARFAAQMSMGQRKSAYGNMNNAERGEIAARFIQSKTSPIVGLIADLWRGENYKGEPLFKDTTGFSKMAKERFLPLAVQDVIDAMEMSGINGAWTAAPAMIGIGALTYVNDYVKVKQRIAKELGYESWDDIDPKTQLEVQNRNVELQAAEIAFDRQVMGTAWGDWHLAGKAVEELFRENVDLAVAQFKETGDGVQFRKKITKAYDEKKGGWSAREKEPRFADIVDRLNTQDPAQAIVTLGPEQLAIKTYNDALYGDDMYDQFGDYLYDEADIRKQQLKDTMGDKMFKYVEDYAGEKTADLPAEFQELKKAKIAMRPYWEVQDRVERLFGKRFAESPRGKAMISKQKKLMRATRPDIAKYYQLFYANQ